MEPAIAVGVGGLAIAWLLRWVWEERGAGPAAGRAAPSQRSWHCQICAAFYTASAEDRLTICPRCGSYNSDEGVHA